MTYFSATNTRTIVSMTRLKNSPSGNPRYNVLLHGALAPISTKPDAAFVYGLRSDLTGPAEVTFEGGYITNIVPLEES
jgi:hypothetical protein